MFLAGCAVLPPLQKSRLIAAFHLIETSNFNEAKEVIEEMILDEKASQWPRTWYARGLLSVTAYQDGIRRNDRRRFELYPDQLFVAFESFEKARSLDPRGSLDRQIAPKYVYLANEFQRVGLQHYNARRYEQALRSFEKALLITESPLLSVQLDTNLIYNAALAAVESKNKEAAIRHLARLDKYNHSPNISHLLSTLYVDKGDIGAAERVLLNGIKKYDDNKDLILLLADLLYRNKEVDRALEVLEDGFFQNPGEYIFPFTRGLILQKEERYAEAIESYKLALALAEDRSDIYANIAISFYNIGVEIDKRARTLNSNREVMEERARSREAFESAVGWLARASEQGADNHANIRKLQQLFQRMNISAN